MSDHASYYETLVWCELHRTVCKPHTRAIVETVERAYGPRLQSLWSCPPGDEPPPPEAVAQNAIITAMFAFPLPLTDAAEQDVHRYTRDRYEAAHAAWTARTNWCATWAPTDPPPKPPPPKPPPTEPPTPPTPPPTPPKPPPEPAPKPKTSSAGPLLLLAVAGALAVLHRR